LQRQLRETGRLGDLVGGSKPMQEVMRIVEMAAPSSASVLITGETGSARKSWRERCTSCRRGPTGRLCDQLFRIPETLMESEFSATSVARSTGAAERRIGCFELADAGTLLLDEIGEMPRRRSKTFARLGGRKVRRLGEKRNSCGRARSSATNKEPEAAVSSGQCGRISTFD